MFRYSVVGLGKLGASMAVAIASRGAFVVGVDIEDDAINDINAGRAPIHETGLDELLRANRCRIRATQSHRDAVLDSDVTFVVVPTPTDPSSGAFTLSHLESAFEEIGDALRDKTDYHVVALTSTVLPGSIRQKLLPILEHRSRKVCGNDFGFCYTPTFVALGSVIRDFLYPDFSLIGQHDDRCGEVLRMAYSEILPTQPECRLIGIENAEIAKIALNAYVTMKITFANCLADICERIPCGDIDSVTAAIGLDRRIGSRYLNGALGYGGPCFPRDVRAMSYIASQLGTRMELAEVIDRVNRAWPGSLLRRLGIDVRQGEVVAVLGIAYKPLSDVIDDSQGLLVAKELISEGVEVIAHDPLVADITQVSDLGTGLRMMPLPECLRRASIVIVTTPDPLYRELRAPDFHPQERRVTVVDCWRILSEQLCGQLGIDYVPLGRNRPLNGAS